MAVNKVGKRESGVEEGVRYIDFELLIELLTTVALSQKAMSYQASSATQPNDVYFMKILFLIEKIHFSPGHIKQQHQNQKNVDLLCQIEKFFPQKFKSQKREYADLLIESGRQVKVTSIVLGSAKKVNKNKERDQDEEVFALFIK